MSAQLQIVEDRSYPRVDCRESVQLAPSSGPNFEARLVDVSPDGLQAVCARSDALVLIAGNPNSLSGNDKCIRATFAVASDSGTTNIIVDCRLIHSSPTEGNQITFGLKFVQFQGDSRNRLGKFLVAAMEHA